MDEPENDVEKKLNKCTEETCPFRLVSLSEGLLCFDHWRIEYVKPPEQIFDNWCKVDFRGCPYYMRNLREIELKKVIEKIEALVEGQLQDIIGTQEKADALREEFKNLRHDLRMTIFELLGNVRTTSSLVRGKSKTKYHVETVCPDCSGNLSYRQRQRLRSVKAVQCKPCGSRLISRYVEGDGIILEKREEKQEDIICPGCGGQFKFEIDSYPGSSTTATCSPCGSTMRITRTLQDEINIRLQREEKKGSVPSVLTEEIIQSVKRELPSQPWPSRTHRFVGEKLKINPRLASRAMNELVRRGECMLQIDGKLYTPVGNQSETLRPDERKKNSAVTVLVQRILGLSS